MKIHTFAVGIAQFALILFALVGCATEVIRTSSLPVATFQARPQYPFDMRRQGIGGEVVVGFIVDTEGRPVELYVVSSTRKEFEPAAVQAVSKWKFKPGMVNDRPVYTRMQVPIFFALNQS